MCSVGCQPHKSGDLHGQATKLPLGELMEAEKAFWEYWKKRWPFTSCNEKTLSLSANFRNTKEAFLAGWEAKGNAQQEVQTDSAEPRSLT